jgi:phosphatidylserine/phosphatidylglycerophosphate/cardiolipin synthase-like enzyme
VRSATKPKSGVAAHEGPYHWALFPCRLEAAIGNWTPYIRFVPRHVFGSGLAWWLYVYLWVACGSSAIETPPSRPHDLLRCSFACLRKHDVLYGKPVSNQVYVHSKLLIADDTAVICGSGMATPRSSGPTYIHMWGPDRVRDPHH